MLGRSAFCHQTQAGETAPTMKIQRRTWIKAAAAAIASAALPGCKPEVHKLVPYLIPDDEIVPGVADWYASTCGECSAGCGVLVRTMEGRAKKLEGNPDHPVNEGKLCARGQAGVQALYHPDRLHGPLSRDRRGAGDFTPVSWDEAVQAIAEALRHSRGRILAISKPLSGSSAALVSEFMEMVGGRLYWYDPAADLPHRTNQTPEQVAARIAHHTLPGDHFYFTGRTGEVVSRIVKDVEPLLD